jgi:hypothetical protein
MANLDAGDVGDGVERTRLENADPDAELADAGRSGGRSASRRLSQSEKGESESEKAEERNHGGCPPLEYRGHFSFTILLSLASGQGQGARLFFGRLFW